MGYFLCIFIMHHMLNIQNGILPINVDRFNYKHLKSLWLSGFETAVIDYIKILNWSKTTFQGKSNASLLSQTDGSSQQITLYMLQEVDFTMKKMTIHETISIILFIIYSFFQLGIYSFSNFLIVTLQFPTSANPVLFII